MLYIYDGYKPPGNAKKTPPKYIGTAATRLNKTLYSRYIMILVVLFTIDTLASIFSLPIQPSINQKSTYDATRRHIYSATKILPGTFTLSK